MLRTISFVILAALAAQAQAADWQTRANAYKRELIREARAAMGLDAPVAMLAAQIHQESLWRPNAQSKYANGLTQFTPETEAWIKGVFPSALGQGHAFRQCRLAGG